VLVTAVIIALGTGTYAGLGGTTPWRLQSADASYAALRYHDLRVRLPERTSVDQGRLLAAVRAIPHADQVRAADERLILPLQVDASWRHATVLVPGEIVGAPIPAPVDRLHVVAGRAPSPTSTDEVAIDSKFVTARSLPSAGRITVSGGHRIRYVGTGYTPEYFRVIGGGQNLAGEHGFAVLFAPLSTAQRLGGREGQVNDLVVRLRSTAHEATVARELRAAVAGFGGTVDTRADDEVRRTLYADAENDETMWTFLSLLVLAGASFAAFNLVTRMVEAERHEIGVGMALGAPPRLLAARPLLVGLQIAVLGAALGMGVAWFAGEAMRSVLTTALPLPVWRTPFQVGRYAVAAAAGVLLPMLATVIPVRRAVRVEAVDALRTIAPTAGRGGGRQRRRLRRRGHVVAMMPVRNVVRAPRRSILTALGIGAAMTTLVTVLGMVDSIFVTLHESDAEVGRMAPRRLEVALNGFVPRDAPVISEIRASPTVGRVEPELRIAGTLRHGNVEVETAIDVIPLGSAIWTPSISSGTRPVGRPGLVIAEKAADDLGVRPGDRLVLDHPVRSGMSYRLEDTEVTVAGLHPNPIRFFSYVDASQVDLFGLRGIVDRVVVLPARGHTPAQVTRALFSIPGVASVQEVGVLSDTIERRMSQLTGILRVLEGFALVMALLIAVNSASLAVEERRREQATMFAFGLPVGTVMRSIMVEASITAIAGTAAGIAGGVGALGWLLHVLSTETLPEFGVRSTLSAGTIAAVVLLGVGVSSCAPLFALRRLRRTDVPATLRVLE
jgi:putative ABC transport system permease protein